MANATKNEAKKRKRKKRKEKKETTNTHTVSEVIRVEILLTVELKRR